MVPTRYRTKGTDVDPRYGTLYGTGITLVREYPFSGSRGFDPRWCGHGISPGREPLFCPTFSFLFRGPWVIVRCPGQQCVRTRERRTDRLILVLPNFAFLVFGMIAVWW